jgi:hypothetical protein
VGDVGGGGGGVEDVVGAQGADQLQVGVLVTAVTSAPEALASWAAELPTRRMRR